MCILLLSTLHPDYPLILINNRDEFLDRPTAPASFWDPPDTHVLGGRDLLRAEHGTWLGITRQGRLAVLTNFRDEEQENMPPISGTWSRGAIPNAWLKSSLDSHNTVEDFLTDLNRDNTLGNVGGFSLLCGHLRQSKNGQIHPLAIISNRSMDASTARWILQTPGEVQGLSNSAFHDPWPKVQLGIKALRSLVDESVTAQDTEDELIKRLFALLSRDTLPAKRPDESFERYVEQLRHSIFIPPLQAPASSLLAHNIAPGGTVEANTVAGLAAAGHDDEMSPRYGTQKQTVILVDRKGQVTFVERSLFDEKAKPVADGKQERRFRFNIPSSEVQNLG